MMTPAESLYLNSGGHCHDHLTVRIQNFWNHCIRKDATTTNHSCHSVSNLSVS